VNETIAAIATPLSPGGIGIIRISGDDAKAIADQLFVSPSGASLSQAKGYSAHYGLLKENGEKIDECIALVFSAPKSYTGEDVVEFSLHGGVFVVKKALRAVLSTGARLAEPGEFTKRAYFNGKLTLTEAEAIMDIISAGGKQALQAANTARNGALYHKIQEITQGLTVAAAHISAFTDFPDEGLPDMDFTLFEENLRKAKEELNRLLSTFDSGVVLREGISCAIIGRPNVGKSTLMNLLSGCERSIVTDIAGTTRDVIEETVKLGEVFLRLSDTAGIRNTEDTVESIGVHRAKERLREAALILAVFDASEELTDDDREILALLADKKSVIIINKTDLPVKMDMDSVKHFKTIQISAAKGTGLEELVVAVNETTGLAALDPNAAILASERQKNCVIKANQAVTAAENEYKTGQMLDIVGFELEEAITALLELNGEKASETVVNEVFSRFCVGK